MCFVDEIIVEYWLLKLIEVGDGDIFVILCYYGIDIDIVWDVLFVLIEYFLCNFWGKLVLFL